MILSSFGAIDLPCFDLIISGSPNPYILCSEKNTLDILSENSKIWPILFELLFNNCENTDLASAIRAAYNLHNSRKTVILTIYLLLQMDYFLYLKLKEL